MTYLRAAGDAWIMHPKGSEHDGPTYGSGIDLMHHCRLAVSRIPFPSG